MNKKEYLLLKLKMWNEIKKKPELIQEIIKKYKEKYPEIFLKKKS